MDKVERSKDISIIILKCIAAILITNSHMNLLYGKYAAFATGGAIGDVLFFFCSGYTLFLGRGGSFFNWYKRRINRIYPTVFSWALLSSAFISYPKDMFEIITSGGGWFVSCIMCYYVVLWFIKKYAINHLKEVFGGVAIVVLLWYFMFGFGDLSGNSMYGYGYFRWCHYFLFMLLGAIIGLKKSEVQVSYYKSVKMILLIIFINVILFYTLCWFKHKTGVLYDLIQISSLVPLLVICFYFYKLCNTSLLIRLYNSHIMGTCMKFIGGLCFEIYIVQSAVFTDKLNFLFPLNLFLMFAIILVAAYLLRCCSNIWKQTFREEDYNWRAVFRVI